MKRHSLKIAFLFLAALFVVVSAQQKAQTGVLFEGKSEFNKIQVRQDEGGIRRLVFEDGATQSEMDVANPDALLLSYTRTSMTALAAMPNPKSMLIIGLGGGSMPMYLRRAYPEAQIDCAELDPLVAEVARKFFNFRTDARLAVHVGDGRKFIEKTANRYDIIFLDAYGADSIPYSLATAEFLRAVRAALTPEGIVVANVWSSYSNKLYWPMVKTYQAVFPELHIISAADSGNRIFIALPQPRKLTTEQLQAQAKTLLPRMKPALDLPGMIQRGYDAIGQIPADTKVLVDADEPK